MEVIERGLKTILAYTNPIVLFSAIPLLAGIMLSVIVDNVASKTIKIVKKVDKDLM